MKCVKCPGNLATFNIGEVRLDRCPRCRGMWFDHNELDRVLTLAREGKAEVYPDSIDVGPLSDKLDAKLGRCPRCVTDLSRTESLAVPGLFYDHCESCSGDWLDGGELVRLAADDETSAIAGFFSRG